MLVYLLLLVTITTAVPNNCEVKQQPGKLFLCQDEKHHLNLEHYFSGANLEYSVDQQDNIKLYQTVNTIVEKELPFGQGDFYYI